jgi:hypothetical protein
MKKYYKEKLILFVCIVLHPWIVRDCSHRARKSDDIVGQGRKEIHNGLGRRLQGIHVLMLDNGGITQIHAKRVSEPTKALLDVVGGFAGFVE